MVVSTRGDKPTTGDCKLTDVNYNTAKSRNGSTSQATTSGKMVILANVWTLSDYNISAALVLCYYR